VWTEPLMSVGRNTFIADALRWAGAVSIVDSSQDWPQISLEEVARLQPEYLVFASSHTDAGAQDLDGLANRPGWRILDAVRERHFAVISDAIIRPAPRIVSVIEDLARQLHPGLFPEAPEMQKAAPPANSATPDHSLLRADALSLDAAARTVECSCAR
jgi:ABC-type Fe3+-hydroxamate transport system substrate-binding protein